jgi:beta-glucanase (GH16 family)
MKAPRISIALTLLMLGCDGVASLDDGSPVQDQASAPIDPQPDLAADAADAGDPMPGWTLAFDEEFDGPLGLWDGTSGRWKTVFNWGGRSLDNLPGNDEHQCYVDPGFMGLGLDPFSIDSGVLAISAEQHQVYCDPSATPQNLPYTSGLLTSEPSFTQTYGWWEIRARFPRGKGLWPAFWLLPADQSWPPEIDVLEVFGGQNSRGEGATNMWHQGSITASGNSGDWHDLGFDHTADFHTYAIDWEPDFITWFVDGKQMARSATGTDQHKPMYLLLNLAVGGDWPEMPDDQTVFPARMLVDWVRVYTKP